MTGRAVARPKGFRRFERWLVGVVFAVMAFALEKIVMRSVRKKGEAAPDADATTVVAKGGEVDVDV